MKEEFPHWYLQGQFGGINIRYELSSRLGAIHFLVMISKQGAITQVFMIQKQWSAGGSLTWSTLAEQAGIENEHIDSFGVPDPWLRYSHIIYTDKSCMTEIYEKHFQDDESIHHVRELSRFIKHAIAYPNTPTAVNTFLEYPNLIDAAYELKDDWYPALLEKYLHVHINSDGYIVDAYIAEEP